MIIILEENFIENIKQKISRIELFFPLGRRAISQGQISVVEGWMAEDKKSSEVASWAGIDERNFLGKGDSI